MSDVQSLNKTLAEMDDNTLSRLYMSVFNVPNGDLVLQDLKNRAFYYNPYLQQYAERGTDPLLLAYRDGMRSVVLTIESRLMPLEPIVDTGDSPPTGKE